jgi:hypothetical protein
VVSFWVVTNEIIPSWIILTDLWTQSANFLVQMTPDPDRRDPGPVHSDLLPFIFIVSIM